MKTISAIFYLISFFAALIGGAMFLISVGFSKNAIQDSSGAAVSLAVTIIPYCAARCFGEFVEKLGTSKIHDTAEPQKFPFA